MLLKRTNLFGRNFADLGFAFFVTRSTAFFSSNVFVISILVFFLIFLIRKQSLKLTLKTKRYHSCGCCDYVSKLSITEEACYRYFEKKLDLEPESTSVTGKLSYHYNSWVTGVYIAYMFDRNSGGKTFQIDWLFESNLKSFGYIKCSIALSLSLDPSCKDNSLTRVGWVL